MLRCLLLNAIVFIAAAAAWFYYQNTQKQLLVSTNQIRDARVQLQHTEQQLHRLEKEASNPLLAVLGEDVTTLQIRLAEFLASLKIDASDTVTNSPVHDLAVTLNDNDENDNEIGSNGNEASGVVMAYEQYVLPEAALMVGDAAISGGAAIHDNTVQVLRLDVQLQTAHAPHLLEFMQQLEAAAGGWPMDVRACEVNRSVRVGISSRCVLDIYYWAVSGTVDSISQDG